MGADVHLINGRDTEPRLSTRLLMALIEHTTTAKKLFFDDPRRQDGKSSFVSSWQNRAQMRKPTPLLRRFARSRTGDYNRARPLKRLRLSPYDSLRARL